MSFSPLSKSFAFVAVLLAGSYLIASDNVEVESENNPVPVVDDIPVEDLFNDDLDDFALNEGFDFEEVSFDRVMVGKRSQWLRGGFLRKTALFAELPWRSEWINQL